MDCAEGDSVIVGDRWFDVLEIRLAVQEVVWENGKRHEKFGPRWILVRDKELGGEGWVHPTEIRATIHQKFPEEEIG